MLSYQATNDLHRTGRKHLKLHMEPKRACIAKIIISKKQTNKQTNKQNKAGDIMIPDFKL